MKVLCFLPELEGGGAQRTMVNLANAFPSFEIEVTLAVAHSGRGMARTWLDEQTEVVDLGLARTRTSVRPLRRLIRALRPNILFSTMVDANIVAAAALIGLDDPPRLVVRETNSHRSRGDIGWMRRRLAGWSYRSAARVIALSRGVERELTADYGLKTGRVLTIHNPVDVDGFASRASAARRRAPPWQDTARKAPGDRQVLLAVGRLTRQKGFDILLQAFARIERRDVSLIILGEGSDRAALTALAETLGLHDRVAMPGFVVDPVPWLAHADLFILSSRWEGFGHVVVEAMAAGTPVIATDCPHGPADIVEPGLSGLLIAPEDPAALAGAIDDLLADPDRARTMARAARSASRRFSVETIAARYVDVFRDVVTSP